MRLGTMMILENAQRILIRCQGDLIVLEVNGWGTVILRHDEAEELCQALKAKLKEGKDEMVKKP